MHLCSAYPILCIYVLFVARQYFCWMTQPPCLIHSVIDRYFGSFPHICRNGFLQRGKRFLSKESGSLWWTMTSDQGTVNWNLTQRGQESKPFAFVFQWPLNFICPSQSLGNKLKCTTRFSCTFQSISYLLEHPSRVIRRWMKFKDFPMVLLCECIGPSSLFRSLFLFVLLIAFHKATELS